MALLIFLATQAVVSVCVAVFCIVLKANVHDWVMRTAVVPGILAGIIVLFIPQFGLRRAFSRLGCRVWPAAIAFAGALLMLFAGNMLNEICSFPDIFQNQFLEMSTHPLNILLIGVVGPVAEEIIFRGGIMRPMLIRGIRPATAILVSALAFAIVHINPAQVFFALVIGVVLGVLYWRTGSLVLSSVVHAVNNTVSVCLMAIYGDKAYDTKMIDFFSGDEILFYVAFIGIAVIGIALLYVFCKRTSAPCSSPS